MIGMRRQASALLFLTGMFMSTRVVDIGSDLPLFLSGFLLASVGFLGLLFWGLPLNKRLHPILLIVLILMPRLMALNMEPSDDLARYVWEGRILMKGFNPYSLPPDDPELIEFRDADYPVINHKDMPGIYPPLTQFIFAGLSTVTTRREGFRIFLLLVELAALVIMRLWLKTLGKRSSRILVYALNPLVIIGIAGRGHLDSLQILFLVSGLYLFAREKRGLSLLAVTLAGLVKYLAFFALPFFLSKKTLKYLPLCLGLILLTYVPFFSLSGGASLGNMNIYLNQFEYYSLTFLPFRALFGTQGALAVTAAVLGLALAGLWLTKINPDQALPPFLLAVTLMNTTVHYWYIIPLIAVSLVWRPHLITALSLLFMPAFTVFGPFVREGVWTGEIWRPLVTYIPFLILLFLEISGRRPAPDRQRSSLGVVIPTLNDANALDSCLAGLSRAGIPPDDIIVADGGSDDGSPAVARSRGVRVVECPQTGRGAQISFGLGVLGTDLAVVLHADNGVPADFADKIRRSAAAYPDSLGGACLLRHEGGPPGIKLVSLLSNLKTLLFGLSFGDQGQWFRRSGLRFPDLPLMEDVETALLIQTSGPAVLTPVRLSVSSRRYIERGMIKTLRMVTGFTLLYLWRRRWLDTVPDTRTYYKTYYSDKK